jgi:hypothetical protein
MGGNLDLYKQKIQFYYEQLGGDNSCNKLWWNTTNINNLNTEISNDKNSETDILKKTILEQLIELIKIKKYNDVCSLYTEYKKYKDIQTKLLIILQTIILKLTKCSKNGVQYCTTTNSNTKIDSLGLDDKIKKELKDNLKILITYM